jgi:hypothetical protein
VGLRRRWRQDDTVSVIKNFGNYRLLTMPMTYFFKWQRTCRIAPLHSAQYQPCALDSLPEVSARRLHADRAKCDGHHGDVRQVPAYVGRPAGVATGRHPTEGSHRGLRHLVSCFRAFDAVTSKTAGSRSPASLHSCLRLGALRTLAPWEGVRMGREIEGAAVQHSGAAGNKGYGRADFWGQRGRLCRHFVAPDSLYRQMRGISLTWRRPPSA